MCRATSLAALCALITVTFAVFPAYGADAKHTNPTVVITTSMGAIEAELFADAAPRTVANFVDLAQGRKAFTDPKTGAQVSRPFYDGLIFHRVIKNFMIQGGDPLGNGAGGPGYQFADEIDAIGLGLNIIKAMDPQTGPHPWMGIRDQRAFQMQVVQPLFRKMGIDSQEELDRRAEEVRQQLDRLTLMDAYENLGYRYSDDGSGHRPVRGSLAMANSGPNTNGSQFFINLVKTEWLTGKHTVFGKVTKGMDVVDAIGDVAVDGRSKPVTPVVIESIRLKTAP